MFQISWSEYWSPKPGIAVKLRPFFVIQNNSASLFSATS
jgi:hypothetical protein